MDVSLLRLMLVTDDVLLTGRNIVDVCVAAVRGGVSSVQLRLKAAEPRELAEAARAVLAAVSVPILVNDRADVAIAVGAAGVHLGPEDTPVVLVRRVAPPGFVIGASVGSDAEAHGGVGADYWGIGPWRTTATKPDAGAALGPEGFRRLRRLAGGRPCVTIGGIRPGDVPDIVAEGAVGIAVVSGLLAPGDTEAAARDYASRVRAFSPSREGQS